MSKNIISLLLFITISSCQNKILPKSVELDKIESFYIGLIEISIYDIKSYNLTNDFLKSYPKKKSDFNIHKWENFNHDSEIYLKLKYYINDNILKRENNHIKEILSNLESNNSSYIISGYYDLRLGLGSVENKLFYYIYVIDPEKHKLYKFDISNYW